ncbi:transposase [Bifidobacterium tibiigranuli]|uniref:transposase n=2 Tax=Bifidobacterium tibiigranuli TaxID=2172043 RepID=UPI001F235840|nr:transposase [Bifidobacterium tibiigranuli]
MGGRRFSVEERARAVEEYFARGMNAQEVVRRLGWPSRSALAAWVRADARFRPHRGGRPRLPERVRAARCWRIVGAWACVPRRASAGRLSAPWAGGSWNASRGRSRPARGREAVAWTWTIRSCRTTRRRSRRSSAGSGWRTTCCARRWTW